VTGVSAAAKLDAASIVAKNEPERMHHPKAVGGLFVDLTGSSLANRTRINLQ
jgi:hypothetical protein